MRSDVLASVPLLAAVDAGRREALAEHVTERRFGDGQVVRLVGETARELPLLIEGTVTAVRVFADGRQLRLGDFPARCALDKTAVLDGAGHTATFRARTACTVWLLPRGEFLALIDDVTALRRHVLTHLTMSVREQQDRLIETAFADATDRVAAWLVRSLGDAGTEVPLPGSQEGLAEVLGLTRVTVNRSLRALERLELVRLERGTVRVLAPELLAARVNALGICRLSCSSRRSPSARTRSPGAS